MPSRNSPEGRNGQNNAIIICAVIGAVCLFIPGVNIAAAGMLVLIGIPLLIAWWFAGK